MVQNKVIAYIVHGDSLVAFVHANDSDPLLESGLQVPAGTVEEGEAPSDAVLCARHSRKQVSTGFESFVASGVTKSPGRAGRRRSGTSSTSQSSRLPQSGDTSRTTAVRVLRNPSGCSGCLDAKAGLLAAAQGVFVAAIDRKIEQIRGRVLCGGGRS